jgi:hypothetical protein
MSSLIHRRLRAPDEDGAALIDPPLSEVSKLIDHNRRIGAQFDRLGVLPADYNRKLARQALLTTSAVLSKRESRDAAERPLILTGHQPELFHPGVWFKNFVISTIAKANAGSAVNLVIDSDVARNSGIRVPTVSGGGQRVTEVLFDAPTGEIPWEERQICDESMFRNFAVEVNRALAPLWGKGNSHERLLIDELWPLVTEKAEREAESLRQFAFERSSGSLADDFADLGLQSASLANAIAGGRHRLEQRLGLAVHDAIVSNLLMTDVSFDHFLVYLFRRHRKFHDVHNAALAEFRHANHVRSHSHPFPELTQRGDWYEMPLWVWSLEDLRRRRAFVRHLGEEWELWDGESPAKPIIRGPLRGHELFAFGQTRGIKIRPRALITTMYARLVLSDLFIHGIGGAKYDELTDLIIRRFFAIDPPAYLTATATFRLPIDRPNVSLDDVRQSAQRLRDLRYRPESFLRDVGVKNDASLSQKLAAFAADKRAFLDQHNLRHCSQDVFDRLDAINRAMHDLLRDVEEESRVRHAELFALARQSQLLGSREFSFVLFPSEKLPARLLVLSKGIA